MAGSAADVVVDIEALTSVCIGAAERAIAVIRAVNRARSRDGEYDLLGDPSPSTCPKS